MFARRAGSTAIRRGSDARGWSRTLVAFRHERDLVYAAVCASRRVDLRRGARNVRSSADPGRSAVTRRHGETVAGVDVGEVQRSLRDVQRRALPPVPSEIRLKIKRIAMTITELLPRAGALGAGSPDTYVLVRCATDYLPTALQGYLDLPRDY